MNREDEVKNGNISPSARILSHLPSRLLQGSIFTQQGGSLLAHCEEDADPVHVPHVKQPEALKRASSGDGASGEKAQGNISGSYMNTKGRSP